MTLSWLVFMETENLISLPLLYENISVVQRSTRKAIFDVSWRKLTNYLNIFKPLNKAEIKRFRRLDQRENSTL